jgi:aspartyl-tRNA(Asn)/glutamyl-tRNA(Gln) amidotransferase subunit A
MAELHELTACQAMEKLAQRECSPVELVEALLGRIAALEPELKAWATLDREGALAAGRRSESELYGGRPGLLEGLPLGVKDIYYTAGLRTEANSPLLEGFVPREDAGAVARLREAGAIILGKTVTTQFADGDPAATRNPWNHARTPGGSSSGSAAAVAARMAPAALGSQTAGSVLRPAGYCGVVGLKPTFGRITRRNVLPFAWSLDTMGVLVRTVRDAALLLQAMAGYDPRDSGSEDRPVDDYRAAADRPRAPRLGIVRAYVERAEPHVTEHIRGVAARLEQAGAEVREVDFPGDLDLALACHNVIQCAEAGEVHAKMHGERPDGFAPRLRSAIEVGQLVPGFAYVRAQRWRRSIRGGVDGLLGQVDALLLPTASNVAPDPSTTGDTSFQAVITMLGLPAISLPSGLDGDGMPFATQLVGRAWDEAGLLQAASWCEEVFEPLPAPC